MRGGASIYQLFCHFARKSIKLFQRVFQAFFFERFYFFFLFFMTCFAFQLRAINEFLIALTLVNVKSCHNSCNRTSLTPLPTPSSSLFAASFPCASNYEKNDCSCSWLVSLVCKSLKFLSSFNLLNASLKSFRNEDCFHVEGDQLFRELG